MICSFLININHSNNGYRIFFSYNIGRLILCRDHSTFDLIGLMRCWWWRWWYFHDAMLLHFIGSREVSLEDDHARSRLPPVALGPCNFQIVLEGPTAPWVAWRMPSWWQRGQNLPNCLRCQRWLELKDEGGRVWVVSQLFELIYILVQHLSGSRVTLELWCWESLVWCDFDVTLLFPLLVRQSWRARRGGLRSQRWGQHRQAA